MAGKGLERLITTISDQLGTIEACIDNVYYGDPLKKNRGIKLPGNKDRKSTRLNSSHSQQSRMPSSA